MNSSLWSSGTYSLPPAGEEKKCSWALNFLVTLLPLPQPRKPYHALKGAPTYSPRWRQKNVCGMGLGRSRFYDLPFLSVSFNLYHTHHSRGCEGLGVNTMCWDNSRWIHLQVLRAKKPVMMITAASIPKATGFRETLICFCTLWQARFTSLGYQMTLGIKITEIHFQAYPCRYKIRL